MAGIKDDKKCLEQLLNTVSPVKPDGTVANGIDSIIDKTDSVMLEPEPIFTFNAKSEMKAMKARARKTIKLMASHILPEDLLKEEYVVNKMEQDVNTLADLYWQVRSNTLMQNALLEVVGKGNTMPRNFEVFASLTEKISSLNKQIQMTETTLRKTYLDLKLEIYDKANEEQRQNNLIPDFQGEQVQMLAAEPNHNVVTGTSKLIELMQAKKTLEMKTGCYSDIDEQN